MKKPGSLAEPGLGGGEAGRLLGRCGGLGAAFVGVLVARVAAALLRLGVESLLLLGRQRGVEGLGSLAPAVGLGGVLGAQGPHAVDALGRGELGPLLAVRAGGALAALGACSPAARIRATSLAA